MKESWWQRLLRALPFRGGEPRPEADDVPSTLDAATLQQLVEMIFSTADQELSCEECFDQVDRFAELVLAGKDAAAAMPLVQDHLSHCRCCREEFEALLKAIEAIA